MKAENCDGSESCRRTEGDSYEWSWPTNVDVLPDTSNERNPTEKFYSLKKALPKNKSDVVLDRKTERI